MSIDYDLGLFTYTELLDFCQKCYGDSVAEAITRIGSQEVQGNWINYVIKGEAVPDILNVAIPGHGPGDTYKVSQAWIDAAFKHKVAVADHGSALSTWVDYTASGGRASTVTGGATTLGNSTTSFSTGFVKKPATSTTNPGKYQAAVLLKTPLPTVAAAVAPLAGVALGATMYADNPELWTRLSQALVPWAYPDNPIEEGFVDTSKGLMPVWTDVFEAAGELVARALLPDFIVDAVKNLFREEGIGGGDYPEYECTSSSYPNARLYAYNGFDITNPFEQDGWTRIVTESVTGLTDWFAYNGGSIIYVSKTPGTVHERWYLRGNPQSNTANISVRSSFVIDGVTYYRGASNAYASWGGLTQSVNIDSSANGTRKAADIYYNGQKESIGGNYPVGTSPWGNGTVYPLPQNPTQIVLQNPDGTERLVDAYPVPMPLSPGQSTDPSEQSIDDPLPDPEKQVDPYIQRTPDPYSDPSPSPDPPGQPDPRTDPSQREEPLQPISPSSPTPEPPPSDGSSPNPTPPVIPPPFTSQGGLVAIYNPTQSELIDFADWLWVTYQDATIQKIWNNPFDGVISLHELYATPVVNGRRTIRSGFLDSEVSSDTVARYSEINCGNIVIPEYWANYLDYAPYTKAFVYLPFIGIIELEADDIVGHAVNITYKVDAYNGSCIALITVAKQGPSGEIYNNTIYQFSGNCAVEVPLTGGTQANIKAAVINATAWGLGSVVSGLAGALTSPTAAGAFGAIGQATSGLIQAANAVTQAKSSVQHSGTFGASFGAMGIKNPYIIVKRPIQVQVLNYNEIYGYQAHKAVTIGSCEGYLRCREVHVTSATANDDEKRLIEQYLKTGVIV